MRHESQFNIRNFHTDGFGHVNNARYLEILEEARWQFAEEIQLIELLNEASLGFIIMDLKIRFRRPVAEGNIIRVVTQLIALGSASGEVLQTVYKENDSQVVTRCVSHFILVDRKDGHSVPIDGAIRDCLMKITEPEKLRKSATV